MDEEAGMPIEEAAGSRQEETPSVPVRETQSDTVVSMLGKDLLKEAESKPDAVCSAVSARIRELMKAENFSILTGAGSSVRVLGSITFGKDALAKGGWVEIATLACKDDYQHLLNLFDNKTAGAEYGVEEFIHFLHQLNYVGRYGVQVKRAGDVVVKVTDVLSSILGGLKERCTKDDISAQDLEGYKALFKRIISRPTNLKRTNLFTTNYDVIFERAMDEMGLIYVDGFVGGLRKFFQPQAFNYDYYYPASTTEGKVTRLEHVLHFYKLHGSLSWIESKASSTTNVCGIEKTEAVKDGVDNVLIYPTPMKEHETIGFPYSELVRRFASVIQQPQSVLITYGYGFGDAHINRAIYEALNIPSFQLVIVSYNWTPGIRAIWEQRESLPCVGFVVGPEYANWDAFTTKLIPDLPTVELEERYEKRQVAAQILRYQAQETEAERKETGDGE